MRLIVALLLVAGGDAVCPNPTSCGGAATGGICVSQCLFGHICEGSGPAAIRSDVVPETCDGDKYDNCGICNVPIGSCNEMASLGLLWGSSVPSLPGLSTTTVDGVIDATTSPRIITAVPSGLPGPNGNQVLKMCRLRTPDSTPAAAYPGHSGSWANLPANWCSGGTGGTSYVEWSSDGGANWNFPTGERPNPVAWPNTRYDQLLCATTREQQAKAVAWAIQFGLCCAVTESPTSSPTASPSAAPSDVPTAVPTTAPTNNPTSSPTDLPTYNPTAAPTNGPTTAPTSSPTTTAPTSSPTDGPSASPSVAPTGSPSAAPTAAPTASPTIAITGFSSAFAFDAYFDPSSTALAKSPSTRFGIKGTAAYQTNGHGGPPWWGGPPQLYDVKPHGGYPFYNDRCYPDAICYWSWVHYANGAHLIRILFNVATNTADYDRSTPNGRCLAADATGSTVGTAVCDPLDPLQNFHCNNTVGYKIQLANEDRYLAAIGFGMSAFEGYGPQRMATVSEATMASAALPANHNAWHLPWSGSYYLGENHGEGVPPRLYPDLGDWRRVVYVWDHSDLVGRPYGHDLCHNWGTSPCIHSTPYPTAAPSVAPTEAPTLLRRRLDKGEVPLEVSSAGGEREESDINTEPLTDSAGGKGEESDINTEPLTDKGGKEDLICSGDKLDDWTSNCTDDPTGALLEHGYTCDELAVGIADCDVDVSDSIAPGAPSGSRYLAELCPVSCNNCNGEWRPRNIAAVVVKGKLTISDSWVTQVGGNAEFAVDSATWRGLKKAIADTFGVTSLEVLEFLVQVAGIDNDCDGVDDDCDINGAVGVDFEIKSERCRTGRNPQTGATRSGSDDIDRDAKDEFGKGHLGDRRRTSTGRPGPPPADVHFSSECRSLTLKDADAVTQTPTMYLSAVAARINSQPEFQNTPVDVADLGASAAEVSTIIIPPVAAAGFYGTFPDYNPCPVGKWSSAVGIAYLEDCEDCPAGTWSHKIGITIEEDCENEEIAAVTSSIAALENNIIAIIASIAAQGDIVTTQGLTIAAQGETNVMQDDAIATLIADLDNATSTNAAQGEAIVQLEKEAAANKAEVAATKADVATAKAEIAELKVSVAKLLATNSTINEACFVVEEEEEEEEEEEDGGRRRRQLQATATNPCGAMIVTDGTTSPTDGTTSPTTLPTTSPTSSTTAVATVVVSFAVKTPACNALAAATAVAVTAAALL